MGAILFLTNKKEPIHKHMYVNAMHKTHTKKVTNLSVHLVFLSTYAHFLIYFVLLCSLKYTYIFLSYAPQYVLHNTLLDHVKDEQVTQK